MKNTKKMSMKQLIGDVEKDIRFHLSIFNINLIILHQSSKIFKSISNKDKGEFINRCNFNLSTKNNFLESKNFRSIF